MTTLFFTLFLCCSYILISLLYISLLLHYTIQCKDTLPYRANIDLHKVYNRNTRKRPDACSKLTIKIPERRHQGRSGVFIINFELFHTFSKISYWWLYAGKNLLGKLSDILFVWYLFQCVYWRKVGLNKKQCREFHSFSYFTHAVRCDSRPSMTQIIHSRNTAKFVSIRLPNFGVTKIKQKIESITMNSNHESITLDHFPI